MNGYINKIESFATLDGDGIRCAVFFQGCPLRCAYCHNPETHKEKCGERVSADGLVSKILRFKPYFRERGGVTLTGGEPLMQSGFCAELAKKLKENAVNVALDTSGQLDGTAVLPFVDSVILDLKFHNEYDYGKYTGGSLEKTLVFWKNAQAANKPVRIRTVVVPGINDSYTDMDKYAAVACQFRKPDRYELLGFHTLGFSKYAELGAENRLKDSPALDETKLCALQRYLDGLLNA